MSTCPLARYALRGARLPDVRLTLPFGEAARRAAQAVYGRLFDRSASPIFSGKNPDGTPLAGHRHAFFIPTDEDGDGRLDHISLWAAEGFGPNEQRALPALKQVYAADPQIQTALERLPGATAADFPQAALLQTAQRWRSVTPFSPTRHFKERGQKHDRFPPEQLPEANLREEAARRGLPDILTIAQLETGGLWRHAERQPASDRPVYWLEFHQRRASGDGRHGHALGVGFEIEFAKPVSGPIALGYACHFGLGLFIPV